MASRWWGRRPRRLSWQRLPLAVFFGGALAEALRRVLPAFTACIACRSVSPKIVPIFTHPPVGRTASAHCSQCHNSCSGVRHGQTPLSRRLRSRKTVRAFGDSALANYTEVALDRRAALFLGGQFALIDIRSHDAASAITRTAEERQTAQIFRESTPSVVSVGRKFRPGERRGEVGAEDGLPPSFGSGFVWDAYHIVTNNHVVREVRPDELLVIFSDSSSGGNDDPPRREVVSVVLVGSDPASDIAVLRVVPDAGENRTERFMGMRPLARGVSKDLEVGQTVLAIGNPFGLDHSLSRGVISGISRTLRIGERPIRGCIQTDASINPGNSGGPLLDMAGRVIGVNTAILTPNGGSAGIGLAIPVDTVSKNVDLILKQGFVSRGYLGMYFSPSIVSESLLLPGLVVFKVEKDSPAERAGVRPMSEGTLGDIVIAFDGQSVRTTTDIYRLIDRRSPGDNVTIGVRRGARRQDGTVEVQELVLNATLGSSNRPSMQPEAR
mmetsp:Transcript_108512/g.305843  ORF Transcript_108512/g.305843 Transcript_108512/m.305843 type:complete len:496 (-) Transcript_108512:164-1651(-)